MSAREQHPGAPAERQACPVCVFHAENVSADALRGKTCFNCGRDLGEHASHAHSMVPLGQAFAVDTSALDGASVGAPKGGSEAVVCDE